MNRCILAAVIAATAVLAGCERGAATCGSLLVTDAWVREAPPGVDAYAGYLAVFNSGGGPVTITGATSPDFGKVMMHRTEQDDGQMRMRELEQLKVSAGGKGVFQPGESHLMLMEPRTAFAEGDEVELKLQCTEGETPRFTAPVRRESPPAG